MVVEYTHFAHGTGQPFEKIVYTWLGSGDGHLNFTKRDGTLVMVGVPDQPHPPLNIGLQIFSRLSVAGSLIGGIAETQEMLDFCAEKGIVADIEMIRMQDIETAYARMQKSDVKYRFVIDTATLSQ